MSAQLLPTPRGRDLAALLNGLAEGAGAGVLTDIRAHEALGWEVRQLAAGRVVVRGPGCTWRAMPRLSREVDAAAAMRPWGWLWRAGLRDDGRGFGWVSAPTARPGAMPTYFEANAAAPALALLRACLAAHLHLAVSPAAQLPTRCDCGWDGPDGALLHGGCPDCRRRLPLLGRAA